MYFSFPVLLLEWTEYVKFNLDGEIKNSLKQQHPEEAWLSQQWLNLKPAPCMKFMSVHSQLMSMIPRLEAPC